MRCDSKFWIQRIESSKSSVNTGGFGILPERNVAEFDWTPSEPPETIPPMISDLKKLHWISMKNQAILKIEKEQVLIHSHFLKLD